MAQNGEGGGRPLNFIQTLQEAHTHKQKQDSGPWSACFAHFEACSLPRSAMSVALDLTHTEETA